MQSKGVWKDLGYRHIMWELLRYYLSIRGKNQQQKWIDHLSSQYSLSSEHDQVPIPKKTVKLLLTYLKEREDIFSKVFRNLRSEEEAKEFCEKINILYSITPTKNKEHHQASKSLVATVSEIASKECANRKIEIDPNPQKRCIWFTERGLHVSARNLDGCIPTTNNPKIVWEIKEYWGKTQGGSKMSDAVYECNLVGRELRDFEKDNDTSTVHIVFVDGKEQWGYRKSDLKRLIDLTYQGLIDHLFIGREVEKKWKTLLKSLLQEL